MERRYWTTKEYKEEIWEKFSELSKQIHEKKDQYLEELEKVYEKPCC